MIMLTGKTPGWLKALRKASRMKGERRVYAFEGGTSGDNTVAYDEEKESNFLFVIIGRFACQF